jgi:hypothetical protein
VASLLQPFKEAVGYRPQVLDNAIRVAQNIQACREIFGTDSSRLNGFDPASVLAALYGYIGTSNVTTVGGKLVSSKFMYNYVLAGNEAVTTTGWYIATIGSRFFATGPLVLLNFELWNLYGRTGAATLIARTETLLHEMGHVYNQLIPQGSGGSQIIDPDNFGGRSEDNRQMIYQKCFP